MGLFPKLIIVMVIAGAGFGIYKGIGKGVEMWDEKTGRITQLEQEKRELESEITVLKQSKADMERDYLAEQAAHAQTQQEIIDLRQQSRERTDIWNRHQFGKLMNAEPEIIERLMQKGTVKVWTRLEAESIND